VVVQVAFRSGGATTAMAASVQLKLHFLHHRHTNESPSEVPHMSSMQIVRNAVVVLALSSVALATSACPEKGPAQKAGEKIDNAVDKTKDAAKDATK
jgi:hypothetical protein